MTEPADTCPVAITVLGVEPVRGAGRLLGLAVVRLQGVGVTRSANGSITVQSPMFRHPNRGGGALLPAAVLPPDLAAAVADEVAAAWEARHGEALGSSPAGAAVAGAA